MLIENELHIQKRDETKLNSNYILYLLRKPLYPMNYILWTDIISYELTLILINTEIFSVLKK